MGGGGGEVSVPGRRGSNGKSNEEKGLLAKEMGQNVRNTILKS